MIFNMPTILSFYTSSFLFATFVWFAVVGYLAHACVIMILTKLSFKQIMQPMLRFHSMALAVSYACTPMVTGLVCMMMQWMQVAMSVQLPSQIMVVYFAWLMYWVSTMFLCSFFVESSCNKFKQALFVADGLILVLGYFVLMLVQQNTIFIG